MLSDPISFPSFDGNANHNQFTDSQFGWVSQDGSFNNNFTGIPLTVEFGGAYWSATYTIRGMKSDEEICRKWEAFFATLGGKSGRFYGYDPDRRSLDYIVGSVGTPLVNGADQRGREIVTSDWTPGITLKAGYYFECNDEYKMITEDVVVDGSGNATISIFPAWRSAPPDDSPIVTTNPMCLMMLDQSNIQKNSNNAKLTKMSFTAREAFNFDTFLITEDSDFLITEDDNYIMVS
jgi:hypothetical protein